jgi:digeranylgeranylglycerophospholipid reductase
MNFELLDLKPSSEFVMNTVNKAVIFSPSGKKLEIEIPYKRFFLHILDRAGFERALAARYNSRGGELLLGTNVLGLVKKEGKIKGLKTTKGDVFGKIIIGADGVESRVGRWCGLSTRLKLNQIFSTAQHMLVDHDCEGNAIEIYFGEKFAPGGYAWMFPKGKGEANFGLGVLASYKKRPIELLAKFKEEKAKHARSTRLVAGCIPSTKPPSRTVMDNVMLVGDAARQTNAVSGGGIANSIIAGKLAGEIAGKVLVENKPLSDLNEYEKAWRDELEKTLNKKFRQRRILESDKNMERMFKVMKLAAFLRPIIPKILLMKWLRPDF